MLFVQPCANGAGLLAHLAHRFPQLFYRAAELASPERDFPCLTQADVPVILGMEMERLRLVIDVDVRHGRRVVRTYMAKSSRNGAPFSIGREQIVKSESSYPAVEKRLPGAPEGGVAR